jgi:Tol biopolymer transport system component
MNSSGTNHVRLTNDTYYYRGPSWSPDGKRLAFVGGPSPSQIYLMDVDGTHMERLTNDASDNLHSAWSPDGTRIAFSCKPDNTNNAYEICVMNADGSNRRRLTTSPGNDFSPAWSSDGLCIVFTSNRDGNSELYAMNADGSNQTRLTNSPANETSPAWQPSGDCLSFIEQDVSSMISMQASNSLHGSGLSSFDITLTNTSTQSIFTPLRLEVVQLTSASGQVKVNNADNNNPGVGAKWDYSGRVGIDNLLSAAEVSSARTLRFNNPAAESFTVTFKVIGYLAR